MIPFKYNVGNLTARRVSTLMTILGIGVVIAVMLSMMALTTASAATVSSGSKDNLMVMREGAEAELSSWVTQGRLPHHPRLPGIAKDSNGEPVISPELVILFKLPRRTTRKARTSPCAA